LTQFHESPVSGSIKRPIQSRMLGTIKQPVNCKEIQMQRTSLKQAPCPVARTLDLVGEWWTLLILRDAFAGIGRFSEFEASLGMSKNVLTARLRKLVEHGILALAPVAGSGAYQQYQLTEKGRSLYLVMVALRQWGEQHLCSGSDLPVRLVDRHDRQPVRLEVVSHTGAPLGVEDLMLEDQL
jgi:DNA-binding HxlR family transcriptional regulator